MAKSTESKQPKSRGAEFVARLAGMNRLLELERAYIIFAVIYIPITWLFLGRGLIEQSILAIYTAIMFVVACVMIGKFAVYLATEANSKSPRIGNVWLVYILNALIPLISLKIYGSVAMKILPIDRHQGLICDLVRLLTDLYYNVLYFQWSLTWVILVSALVVFTTTVWSARSK